MNIATILGLLVAFGSILGGNVLEGGHLSSLYVPVAALIVYGGTFGAVLVQNDMGVFMKAMKRVGWAFITPKVDLEGTANKIVEWSNIARKDGLLGLEGKIEEEDDEFTKIALQMVVDGTDANTIIGIMDIRIEMMEKDYKESMKVWEALGGYAPTIGIIGAVLGLIHVMGNLSDPSALGGGIAVAFVATIYGLVGANILFLPPGNKMHAISELMILEKSIILDGLSAITDGDNPRNIETKLKSYIL
jgi:chemotaxis protein MotA